jgi:3-methyladenine DNA glycosylase/8-oxoguanine DNA glycosylase
VRALKKADPVLAKVIARAGPFALEPKPDETFPALLRSITYQQLNGKAASTILGRVLACFSAERPLTPVNLLKTPDAPLRAAGLSANKLLAMRDLAQKCADGVVPVRAAAAQLGDEELVERLTQVRGIGRWTVQMFLIFYLGRPDVMPSDDFGVRKAFGLLYRKNGRLPPPAVVLAHSKAWAPFRSAASWYLWRSLDATTP